MKGFIENDTYSKYGDNQIYYKITIIKNKTH